MMEKSVNNKIILPAVCLFLIWGGAFHSNGLKQVGASALADGHTLVLYDADSGEIPSAPAMNFIDFPSGGATLTYLDGGTVLDTTGLGNDTYAGWISNGASISGFPILDRTAGFHVDFTIQVEAESHQNNNRAGFSIIVLSEDARGIELAFWENEIWAQGDEDTGGLFKHAEGAGYAATASLIEYRLSFLGDTYTLTANAEPILTGPVRDYRSFEGFPDPYETPNFLFVGDDTTSAQARVRLHFISVTGTEPAVPTSPASPLPPVSPTALPSSTPSPAAASTFVSTPTPSPHISDFCPVNFSMVILIGVLKAGSLRKSSRENKK